MHTPVGPLLFLLPHSLSLSHSFSIAPSHTATRQRCSSFIPSTLRARFLPQRSCALSERRLASSPLSLFLLLLLLHLLLLIPPTFCPSFPRPGPFSHASDRPGNTSPRTIPQNVAQSVLHCSRVPLSFIRGTGKAYRVLTPFPFRGFPIVIVDHYFLPRGIGRANFNRIEKYRKMARVYREGR